MKTPPSALFIAHSVATMATAAVPVPKRLLGIKKSTMAGSVHPVNQVKIQANRCSS